MTEQLIICSRCKSVCPVPMQGLSPWHPGLCLEIICVISAIIVGTNNNIPTSIVWTQNAAVRGKVVDGGCFLTLSSVIWGQFQSFREILLDPKLTL